METTGLKRNPIDKFYTKESVVDTCVDLVKQYLTISFEDDLIVEPSAGNGSFIKGIKTLAKNRAFYDIEPAHDEIVKQDYLELILQTKVAAGKIHVIGNPPFGRQSSTAIKFIKRSCQFCDSVSFILPRSFKKDSLKRSFPLNFHLAVEVELPEKSFIIDGREHGVDTVFQIWVKREHKREVVKTLEPTNFVFVGKDENPDISFRRVGVYAGKIDKDADKSTQSHYFIKFTNDKTADENIELLKNIQFNHNNTVGPRSISKQELIKAFNLNLNL
jgi:predicted RNA methylase